MSFTITIPARVSATNVATFSKKRAVEDAQTEGELEEVGKTGIKASGAPRPKKDVVLHNRPRLSLDRVEPRKSYRNRRQRSKKTPGVSGKLGSPEVRTAEYLSISGHNDLDLSRLEIRLEGANQ